MKISIITATFNSAATVRDTFESILSQGYKDYELVVVDGASKDSTVDIIKEYEPRFEGRMQWKSEPDKGIYDAMNKGISWATGEIVGILNSDDFYTSSDVLESVALAFESAGHCACCQLDAVYGDVHYVESDDTSKWVRYYSSGVFRRSLMRLGFMPAHPSFYCRKSVYVRFAKDCGYFDASYKVAADFENLLRMIFVGKIRTAYLKKDFVTMRNGGASSSGVASHKQINKDHLRALKENGIYSNMAILSFRYLYKIVELILGKIHRISKK